MRGMDFEFLTENMSFSVIRYIERNINFMSKSIGIDLGTTNSVAAIKKVHTEVLKNAEGEFITPSCVTVKKKKLLFSKPVFVVGKHALEWMKQDPENTIVAIKRLMGRSFLNKHQTKSL